MIFAAWGGRAMSQNLVPNHSFEEYRLCPAQEADFVGFVKDWTTYYSTPDYFNLCGYFPSIIESQPYEGRGMIGLRFYNNLARFSNFQREYAHTRLLDSLKADTVYYAAFWINQARFGYGIDRYGLFFSRDPFNQVPASGMLMATPQIENRDGLIMQFDTWHKISGCFTAQGGERYMGIGNFYSDEQTDTISVIGNAQVNYAYVDNIVVRSLSPWLPRDTVVCVKDFVYKLPKSNDALVSYKWNGVELDSIIPLSSPGRMYVDVWLGACGKIGSFEISIDSCIHNALECPVYFPNAFSPNDDGINDVFEGLGSCENISIALKIFDRWGGLVFENTSGDAIWNGKCKGLPCGSGAYLYSAEIRCWDKQGLEYTYMSSGEVMLIR
ncbi:MAG: gliding motility-associated C-terminal domain-containing protein [Saprospiraceae bacterium]|nr:gliding motility-associated C-terminal domain-containing protein [Saprospiraceae bacterium]